MLVRHVSRGTMGTPNLILRCNIFSIREKTLYPLGRAASETTSPVFAETFLISSISHQVGPRAAPSLTAVAAEIAAVSPLPNLVGMQREQLRFKRGTGLLERSLNFGSPQYVTRNKRKSM